MAQFLTYLHAKSTSEKVEYDDEIECIAGGFELELGAREVAARTQQVRRWARCYTSWAYNLFKRFDVKGDWAERHGSYDPYFSDFMEADILPKQKYDEYTALKQRALVRTTPIMRTNPDPDVSDTFSETVVRNPRLQTSFANAGFRLPGERQGL
jgi:hypothetical protein